MSELHVICKIAGSEYAIPASEVHQMETFSGATPVPGASPSVIGLIQIRQKIIPVLNLRTRFGLPAIEATSDSRVVLLERDTRLVGLLVDSAREVMTIASEQLRAAPEAITKQSAGFIKSVVPLKDRIIMLLDTPKVIDQEISHV